MMVRWFFRNKGLGYIGNKKKKRKKEKNDRTLVLCPFLTPLAMK